MSQLNEFPSRDHSVETAFGRERQSTHTFSEPLMCTGEMYHPLFSTRVRTLNVQEFNGGDFEEPPLMRQLTTFMLSEARQILVPLGNSRLFKAMNTAQNSRMFIWCLAVCVDHSPRPVCPWDVRNPQPRFEASDSILMDGRGSTNGLIRRDSFIHSQCLKLKFSFGSMGIGISIIYSFSSWAWIVFTAFRRIFPIWSNRQTKLIYPTNLSRSRLEKLVLPTNSLTWSLSRSNFS